MPASITWYGQAGFVIEGGSARVGVDLFLRPDARLRAPFCTPDAIPPLQAAFCTHEHHDHLDPYTLKGLQGNHPGMEVVVPAPVRPLAEEAGLQHVVGAEPRQVFHYGEIMVEPVMSLHASEMSEGYHFGQPPGRFLGYVFRVGDTVIYHSGDTLMYPELPGELKARGVAVLLLPINGRSFQREASGLVGNLTPEEAADLAAQAGAQALIPMHWDTYPHNRGDIGQAPEWAYRRQVTLIVPRYGQKVRVDEFR